MRRDTPHTAQCSIRHRASCFYDLAQAPATPKKGPPHPVKSWGGGDALRAEENEEGGPPHRAKWPTNSGGSS